MRKFIKDNFDLFGRKTRAQYLIACVLAIPSTIALLNVRQSQPSDVQWFFNVAAFVVGQYWFSTYLRRLRDIGLGTLLSIPICASVIFIFTRDAEPHWAVLVYLVALFVLPMALPAWDRRFGFTHMFAVFRQIAKQDDEITEAEIQLLEQLCDDIFNMPDHVKERFLRDFTWGHQDSISVKKHVDRFKKKVGDNASIKEDFATVAWMLANANGIPSKGKADLAREVSVGLGFGPNELSEATVSPSNRHTGAENKDGNVATPPPKLTQVGTITQAGQFSLRLAKVPAEQNESKEELALEVKGSPSIKKRATIVVVTSLLDITENPSEELGLPVESRTDACREPILPYYQFVMPPVEMGRGGGFIDWQPVAPISPDFLKPPKSGKRLLRAVVRFVDVDNPSDIMAGILNPGAPRPVCEYKHEFELVFEEPGYVEDVQNRSLQRPLYVRLAMGIAMSDGSLDDAEGEIISAWIRSQIDAAQDDEDKASTKEACNTALREAFSDAEAGRLSVEKVCADIKKVSSSSDRYEVLDLCLKVLAADGVADPGEMNFLRRTAKHLDLDLDEFRELVNQVTGGLTAPEATDLQAKEAEAGIDPDASIEDKRKEVRKAFKEWNAREAAATNKEDKDRAQKRLNTLGELRKLYSND